MVSVRADVGGGVRHCLAPWWKVFPVWARQELLLLIREPMVIIFSLVFPVVMYVFIGIPYGSQEIQPGVKFIDMMFPALIVTVAANILIMGLPIYLAALRSRGADRRYAILPLPGWIFAAAVLSAMLILVIAAATVIVTVVAVRDGVRPSAASLPFIGLILGSITWLSAFGFFLGTLKLPPRTIQALSAIIFFTLFFGSGAAIPIAGLPQILQDILEWNPLKQWLDVMVGYYTQTGVSLTQKLRLLIAIPITIICAITGLILWKRR